MGLFSTTSPIEKHLEEIYVPMFQGMMGIDASQAKKQFRDIITQIKEEQKQEGTTNLPKNLGDDFLEREKTDEKTRVKFEKKRRDGVKDEDIRWWYNMDDMERRMLLKVDDLTRMAMFMQFLQNGKNEKEAATEIRRYHPMYGDPDDTTHTKGDDRPLPYELKDRINIYIEKRAKKDPDKYKKEIENSSTFNSLIRREVKAGNI